MLLTTIRADLHLTHKSAEEVKIITQTNLRQIHVKYRMTHDME